MGPFTHWKLSWLRLTADDNTVGESPACAESLPLLESLLGEVPRTLEQWWHQLYWKLRNSGHRSPATSQVIGSIDMAMRDILAKRAEQPWHRYMGAKRDSVPVYASGGGVNLTSDELVEQALEAQRDGYDTFKMKVGANFGRHPDDDVKRVAAVRKALGDQMKLAVDANQCWDAEAAIEFAKRIESFSIAWFEEPVHSADTRATAEVANRSPIPVAFGESEAHWLGFRDLAELGVQHLQPSPFKLPGFRQWREAVDFAEKAGRTWSCGGLSPLGAVYVATRERGMVEYLRPIIQPVSACFSVKPPEPTDGTFNLPTDRPGLPVEVDWAGLRSRNALRCHLDARLRRT